MPYTQRRYMEEVAPRKVSVEAEISALGVKLEEIKKQTDDYQDCSAEIVDAREKLEVFESKLKQTEKDLADKINLLSVAEENLESLNKEIISGKEIKEKQEKEIADTKAKYRGIYEEIETAERKLERYKNDIGKAEGVLSSVELAGKKERENIEEDLKNGNDEIALLKEKKLESENAKTEIQRNAELIEKTLLVKNEEINNLLKLKNSLIGETENQRKEMAEEKEKAEKTIKAKTEELNKREGDLSLRESWLNEKTELLKTSKAELEKFYNKKINNIII